MNTILKKMPAHKPQALLLAFFAAALCILCIFIFPACSADFITFDSSYQYFLNQHPFDEMWGLIMQDYSPPLYSVLLKAYTMLFGDSLLSMRIFSLSAAAGMLFLSFFPVYRAFGRRASLLCGIMTLFSSAMIQMLTEIRPTIFGMFFMMALTVYAYLAFFEQKGRDLVCFTVFSVLGMYTHNVTMLGAFAVYVICIAFALFEKNFKKLKRFLISGIICAVLYIPWLSVVIRQMGSMRENFWTGSDSLADALEWTLWSPFKSVSFPILLLIIKLALGAGLTAAIISRIDLTGLKTAKSLKEIMKSGRKKIISENTVFMLAASFLPMMTLELFNVLVYPLGSKRYYYIFGTVWIMFIAFFAAEYAGRIVSVIICAAAAANGTLAAGELYESIRLSELEKMRTAVEDKAFYHFHEDTLGVMSYYFPEAKHLIGDETRIVLRNLDVFTTDITDVGSIENADKYADGIFYVVSSYTPDAVSQTDGAAPTAVYAGTFYLPYEYSMSFDLYYAE